MQTAVQNKPLLTDPLETQMLGCLENNLSSQEQLYRYCYQQMIGICQRYAVDMDGAGIIFNNAMLRVFKYLPTYRPQEKSMGWIRTIVVNCCLDHVKEKNKFKESEVKDSHEESISIAADVFHRISVKEIQRYIQQMPKATAVVFNLFVYEGFTHRQIAAELGMAEGTSKWHVNEARKFLKAKLDPEKS